MPNDVRLSKRKGSSDGLPTRERYPLPNTLAFLRLLWAVDHGLKSLSKRMQARLGVTSPQRLTLRILGKFPDLTPSELAELLHLDRGTMSGILARLTAQELVTRKPHEDDGRSATLQLTERGRELNSVTAGTVEASVRRALATLPRSKLEIAAEVLEVVARELQRDEQGDVEAAPRLAVASRQGDR
jgi:DNA-binding MarR family transcriptional regulator